MTIAAPAKPLKVAIVGAGPGGLAATINFRRLNNVAISVYDQARELREVGAGISINDNTWRLLQDLGAADAIEQYTKRGENGVVDTEHRNGRTGELLARRHQSTDPNKPPRSRIERYKLQNALLSQIPKNLIQLSKKLAKLEESEEGVTLEFTDGVKEGPFDLVIGADGIRSIIRQYAFPDHKLSYTGKVAYRVLIPQEKVAHIPNIPQGSVFWHTPTTHVYTCPLDNGLFEIATRALEPEEYGAKVSWGQPATKEQVVKHYQGYNETIKAIIDVPDSWLEFAMFGGPRLDSVTKNGRIVLIGDASHPLSGAFGSGAAFAFEDAYVLASVVEFARQYSKSLSFALDLFDVVRSPRYKGLYKVIDNSLSNIKAISGLGLDADEHVRRTVEANWKGAEEGAWIYSYDVRTVWAEHEAEERSKLKKSGNVAAVSEPLSQSLAAISVSA